jgi:hypothetical protein
MAVIGSFNMSLFFGFRNVAGLFTFVSQYLSTYFLFSLSARGTG